MNRLVRGLTKGLTMLVFATVFVAVFGYVVMRLWNWLTPALFGWHLISFWQAVGILVLSKILFGGFHGRGGGRRRGWKRDMEERWEKMSPEEREKFRQSVRGVCQPFVDSAEPKT